MQSESSAERCRFIKENGERCRNMLTGAERSYCTIHRISGRKQTKSNVQQNGKYVESFREYDHDRYLIQNATHQFRHRYGLTKCKFKPLIGRADAPQEYYALSKDDLYQDVLDKLTETKRFLMNPPNDLPGAIAAAEWNVYDLRERLERQSDACHNLVTDRLMVYVEEMRHNMGMWMCRSAFTLIRRRAQEVLKMWHERGDLLNVCHAVFVIADLYRQQFYAEPHRSQLWKKAKRWLDAAAYVCSLYTGEQRQTAAYLAFYAHQAAITLALDAGDPAQATNPIQSLHHSELTPCSRNTKL